MSTFGYASSSATLHVGDCLARMREIDDGSVRTCITSPPYWGLRDYGHDGQIGLEDTPAAYVARLVAVFRDVRRALADDGTLWLNLGDSYSAGKAGRTNSGGDETTARHRRTNSGAVINRSIPPGYKAKDLVGIPWLVAFALRADGWYLRQDLIWHKLNPMPESVTDRCTKAHEYMFLLSKSARYYFDASAIAERALQPIGRAMLVAQHKQSQLGRATGASSLGTNHGPDRRNRRSVWAIASTPYAGAHFATMPPTLVEPCVLAGSAPGDLVLDPFAGAGTTGLVALELGRRFVGIELNPTYAALAWDRMREVRANADEQIDRPLATSDDSVVWGY